MTGTTNGNVWIYVFGEENGQDVKIGRTSKPRILDRLKDVNKDQTTNASYKLLVGIVGTPHDEVAMKRYFAPFQRTDKGSREEYFKPAPEVVEYVNWLRSQWYATLDGDLPIEAMLMENSSHWLPRPERRIELPEPDEGRLVQLYEDLDGPLAGTKWAWMVSDKAQIEDYFTPPELVEAAREAMGGIDLDAASHWLANRVHRIPDYFHTGRDAFANRWYGKVWLNPPYGKNQPWFDAILQYVESGEVEQICMLSPMWVFQTGIARPVMAKADALVLLSPTPKFWGNRDGRTGVNHPHGILYIGDRSEEFKRVFAKFGFTVKLEWEETDFVPEEVEDVAL